MSVSSHDVLVTGIGLVSSLGEGIDAHVEKLAADGPRPVLNTEEFAPFLVHPLPPVDWSTQIPKKGDQRQMETWQKLGTFAAGLALSDAAVGTDPAERGAIDMIVAAGGGERDLQVDSLVMERARGLDDPQSLINQTLTNELRPTLFLAQLSNLMAGNISIVHKVTGSSRTFMGEEASGISAVATAAARIAAGQSEICLIGGAFSAPRKELISNYAMGGFLSSGDWSPVFQRRDAQLGFVPGSVGAFLVLESAEHASRRGARAYARVAQVAADRGARTEEAFATRIKALLNEIGADDDEALLVLSGASGCQPVTEWEKSALDERLQRAALRSFGSLLGHSLEAHFFAGIALGAAALHSGRGLAPFDPIAERASSVAPSQALITTVGHVSGEGMCRLVAVDPS
ncbi:beta-ketoacyl-ACP synthase [Consotaella salsifontis]|uniref:3-oxoacyl-[acyl-carrier-protein] synthase II n=1 Tax=Consotaella salsifontis TaxID=1365950 RepID=A0A1T4LB67_9HYPH|nr:beta-ketoacyl-ACP synthase [Consotaella salsifontis]SJZ51788.1 3-oxoacyl-[acyl-carrier-protein] synthase II [Consotaella salsifontis]